MRRKKIEANNTVSIHYLQGLLSQDDIEDIETIASGEKIKVWAHSCPPRYIAGVEEFFPNLKIILSPDLVIGICSGIIASTIYDILKKIIISVFQKVKEKKITKIHGAGTEETVAPTIHLEVGNMRVVLPTEISDEKFQCFSDHLFEVLKGQNMKEEKYCVFDSETEEYHFLTTSEIIWTDYQKSKEDNHG